MMKKILSAAALTAICATAFVGCSGTYVDKTIDMSGVGYGRNAKCVLTSDGHYTISGAGCFDSYGTYVPPKDDYYLLTSSEGVEYLLYGDGRIA